MCFCCVPDRYLLHFSSGLRPVWWLDRIETLEPGEGRNIPSEKGFLLLEYLEIASSLVIVIALHLLVGGIATARAGIHDQRVQMIWWLFAAVAYPIFFFLFLLNYFRLRLWEIEDFHGSPSIIYVYKPTEGEDQAEISRDWITIDDFKSLNRSYYERVRRKKQIIACTEVFNATTGAIGSIP